MPSMFNKFWNLYYFVGPILWEVRSPSLLLYSSGSRGYNRGMTNRVRQWLSTSNVFRFAKILCLLISAELPHSWHHCFISLILTVRNRRRRDAIVCIRWASAFRGLRVARSGNFFQFYCVPSQQEKREFYTTFPESIALYFFNGYYWYKNI